jgi:hypothetical protein
VKVGDSDVVEMKTDDVKEEVAAEVKEVNKHFRFHVSTCHDYALCF